MVHCFMKKTPLLRALRVVLSLVFVLALIPVITPTALANMHYEGVDLDFDTDTATIHYSCNTCGADYEVDCSIDDFYNDGYILIIEADCSDIELNTDYCQMCFLDHVCMECLTPIKECESFCYNCHQCWDCENDIVTVDPEEFENVILMTFGTDPDAEYRVFALDAKLTPLMDAYDIPREEG